MPAGPKNCCRISLSTPTTFQPSRDNRRAHSDPIRPPDPVTITFLGAEDISSIMPVDLRLRPVTDRLSFGAVRHKSLILPAGCYCRSRGVTPSELDDPFRNGLYYAVFLRSRKAKPPSTVPNSRSEAGSGTVSVVCTFRTTTLLIFAFRFVLA